MKKKFLGCNMRICSVIKVVFISILLFANSSEKVCSASINPKHVLIINSYHQGLAWTNHQTTSIIDMLKQRNDLTISVEYMDWKNYPVTENISYLNDYYTFKYKNKPVDLLITTDDSALEYALKNRDNLFSGAPVVFCGVNQEGIAQITEGYHNFTGVMETIDPTNTVRIAININPALKNIYLLFDNSESGLSTGKLIADKIKSLDIGLNTIPLNQLSFEELTESVKNIKEDGIILLSTYYSDVNGKIIEFESVSRAISENSSVPVYHMYDFGLNNGALGGDMLSGKLQGENAAKLAVRVLDGESADSIPVQTMRTNRRAFDYQQLKKFDIPMDKIPSDCEVINKPFSFFETYKTLVLSVIAAFFILIAFVCILLFYLLKIRKMKKQLIDKNEELSQTYEELAASDEELKQQFDEIMINHKKIRESEERVSFLAYHDALTRLPNKLSLYENACRDIISAKSKVALLFVDIDNFKYINDTLGHAFGDQLILKVSERLTSLLKEGCTVYRLSGDEFIIIIRNIYDNFSAEIFASHVLAGFKEDFYVKDSVLHISLSIGVVIYPEHAHNIEELLKYADIAMYKAKEAGKNRYVVFNQLMVDDLTERVNIEKHLHTALMKNEFEIHYQPQLDLELNKITGFEALLRWENSELGFVSPLKFIKVAEDTHLIIPLGAWVLRNACAFLKKLHLLGYSDLSVSVNISILQLLQTDFIDMVLDTLEFLELEPQYLELEITESVLIESFEAIVIILEGLREKGVKIALDDFGKGYSSLSYLRQLPISTLKIDKSFIDTITTESSSKNIAGQIIRIGKIMGITVVAEGVEHQDQLDYLKELECNKIQGYLFSKPISEEDIKRLLEMIG